MSDENDDSALVMQHIIAARKWAYETIVARWVQPEMNSKEVIVEAERLADFLLSPIKTDEKE